MDNYGKMVQNKMGLTKRFQTSGWLEPKTRNLTLES